MFYDFLAIFKVFEKRQLHMITLYPTLPYTKLKNHYPSGPARQIAEHLLRLETAPGILVVVSCYQLQTVLLCQVSIVGNST